MAKRLIIVVLAALFCGVVFSFNASALELEGGGTIAPQVSESYIRRDMGSNKTAPQISGNNIYWENVPSGSDITQMGIKLSRAIPNLGKNSLLVFSITFQTTHVRNITYYGFTFRDFTILNDSCLDHGPVLDNNNINNSFTCTFIGLSHAPGQDLLETTELTRIFKMNSLTGQTGSFTMLVSPIYYRQVNTDGLTSIDRAWLQQQLGTSSSQSIIDKLDDILQAIPAGASQADIQQAVEDAESNHDDDQQDKYEQQSEDNETAINSDSSAAQGTATTLLSVVGQFISTLTSAQPTNCNLNGNLIPHLPLGNLNLCQNSPPAAITALGSLLLIAFVVPLAYHTVKRMLALIGSFQS